MLAPYDVSLHLVSNTLATADATFAAATLIAGTGTCAAFLGPASTSQGLRIGAPSTNQTGSYLRVAASAYNQAVGPTLIAGEYADTLTVTLSACLSLSRRPAPSWGGAGAFGSPKVRPKRDNEKQILLTALAATSALAIANPPAAL